MGIAPVLVIAALNFAYKEFAERNRSPYIKLSRPEGLLIKPVLLIKSGGCS